MGGERRARFPWVSLSKRRTCAAPREEGSWPLTLDQVLPDVYVGEYFQLAIVPGFAQ